MSSRQNIGLQPRYSERQTLRSVVNSRRRLSICLAGFVFMLLVVLARGIFLEVTQGDAFREAAARPLVKQRDLPAARGRILAADGAVLAHDRAVIALAVKYPYLEETKNKRLAEQLSSLCGLSLEEWNARAARIRARVERISQKVNDRHLREFNRRREEAGNNSQRFWLLDILSADDNEQKPRHITVAEELESHIMVENISAEAAAEIRRHPDRFTGVSIIERTQRFYPRGSLAAHVLGYMGKANEKEIAADAARSGGRLYRDDARCGRAGVELMYETFLNGRPGVLVESFNQSGRLLESRQEFEPQNGRDLVLTIHSRLQETAERLLDDALQRRRVMGEKPQQAGGAIIVVDVEDGGLLVAASAPRFDPNDFCGGDASGANRSLNDPARPMFDRAASMALAPGSTFKTVAAVAFLEEGIVEVDEPFDCQGYLESPERLRCDIYRRLGVGHGPVTLDEALSQSCNVYFFHHASALEPGRLAYWAEQFGFGCKTGVDLPGEATGNLPKKEGGESSSKKSEKRRLNDVRMLAIGQGTLTATPIQVARLMAALANGGRLVKPHVGCVSTVGCVLTHPTGVGDETLSAIRYGLARAVADEKGTAHATLAGTNTDVACKTGSAQSGGGLSAHAWVAGFMPVDTPRYAFVVVIEHGGDAGEAACPVAKRLIVRMEQLGLL